MIEKPEHGDFYAWDAFLRYCERHGIECDLELNDWEDIENWWDCWKQGYIEAMNS